MNASDMHRSQLADALALCADGDSLVSAAVGLLIGHGHWLRREPFLRSVQVWTDPDGDVLAPVNWDAVATTLDTGKGLYDTESERGILGIAASLAGGYRVNLGDVLTSLDRTNLGLVATAVRRAGGLS